MGQGHFNNALEREQPITPELTLYEGLNSADELGYCGLPAEISELPSPPIPFKDTNALVAHLEKMLALVDLLFKMSDAGTL